MAQRNNSAPDAAAGRRVSRGPVVVLVIGAALAVSLVLLGATLSAAPAPTPGPELVAGTDAQPRTVNVIMRDYHFDPTPLYFYTGETVRLNVFNGGMLEHELVLGGDAVQQAWAAADAAATPPGAFASAPPASVEPAAGALRLLLGSGDSVSVVYHVPGAQALQLECHLPGHLEKGMAADVDLLSR